MRYSSRVGRLDNDCNVFPIRPRGTTRNDNLKLSAFRGFLLAACVSALLWGLGQTAIWLAVWRK
jgi:hypothetical protein